MQEKQPKPQRQRQHHADGDIALGELLAEKPHADARDDREADQARERR